MYTRELLGCLLGPAGPQCLQCRSRDVLKGYAALCIFYKLGVFSCTE